jgi:hypothetical protein
MHHCTSIIVRSQFIATHAWVNCPHEEVKFLRNAHRHIFYVTIKAPVNHNDRELEFFMVKKELDDFLNKYPFDLGSKSCEIICCDILDKFKYINFVRVMEDNENGAEITR